MAETDAEPPAEDPREESSAELWVPSGPSLELLRNRPRVVPIIGAGVSQAARLPGSTSLAEALATKFDPHPDRGEFGNRGSLRAVADDVVCRDRARLREVQPFVADLFDRAVGETAVDQISLDLLRVPSGLIVTFNYDRSLEKAADEAGLDRTGGGRGGGQLGGSSGAAAGVAGRVVGS